MQITKQFPNIFNAKGGEDEAGEDEEPKDDYFSHYNWFIILDFLSDGKRPDWDYFMEGSAIAMLNTYSFYKARDKQREIAMKQHG